MQELIVSCLAALKGPIKGLAGSSSLIAFFGSPPSSLVPCLTMVAMAMPMLPVLSDAC